MNDIEKGKQQRKINETKCWFFENIKKKIDKPLARCTKKTKRRLKLQNRKQDITTDSIETKRIIRLL